MKQTWNAQPKNYSRAKKNGQAKEVLMPHAPRRVNDALVSQIREVAKDTVKQTMEVFLTEHEARLSSNKRKGEESDDEDYGIDQLGIGMDTDAENNTESDSETSRQRE